MRDAQRKVLDFHRAFGHTVGETPAIRDADLRKRLVREEAKEFCDAVDAGDVVAAAQEAVDLIYVAVGSLVSFGVDGVAVLDAIHAANMAKLGPDGKPVLDAGGKVVKPPEWEPPDIEAVIWRCPAFGCANRVAYRVDHGWSRSQSAVSWCCREHRNRLREWYDAADVAFFFEATRLAEAQ